MVNVNQPIVSPNAGSRILHFLLFLIGLFFTVVHAEAQNVAPQPVEIPPEFAERKIGRDISILEDPSGQLTFDQVRTPEMAAKFVLSTKESPSFGYTQSTYWVQFELKDQRITGTLQAVLPIYLTLAYAQTDIAKLWCTNKDGSVVIEQRAGDHVPLSEWPISYRMPTFELNPSVSKCWLRITSGASMQMPLTLSTQNNFAEKRLTDSTFQALYFGALLVMLAYNGLIAATTRSWAYGTYTLFLLSFGMFQCSMGGLGYQFLWQSATGWSDSAMLLAYACTGLFACLFAMLLLDLYKALPKLFVFGQIIVGLLLLICFAIIWLVPYSSAIKILVALTVPWCIFLLSAGILLSLRKVRVARIYLTAWIFFIVGTAFTASLGPGLLPINFFTSNALQIGSVFEFILLSFALADRLKTMQKSLLVAQTKISEGLRLSEQELAQKVEQRTTELKRAHHLAEQERDLAFTERTKAELAEKVTAQTLAELKATQTQLIAAEKMASLGLLVSNVAHEINTPIGAVKSSGALIADTLESTLAEMPRLFELLDASTRGLFVQLVLGNKGTAQPISTREERAITKQIAVELEQATIEDTNRKARLLTKLRAYHNPLDYLPLLQHPESDFILGVASNIADVVNSTHNINSAVEKVSRVVYALKALSGDDVVKAAIVARLQPDMDKALAKYQSQMPSVELIKNYQQDMPPIHADHDALEQLCIHLVMNALQAMNYEGKLTVGLSAENNQAIISVADTGTGIADDIKDRIFEPFFTTRTSGEGSGMGLAIVKRIVEQHQGAIDVQTEVGVGTTVKVILPYAA